MTKKPGTIGQNENDALRLLMVSLYGSETEARRVANALLRDISPEEEELLQRRYDNGDEIARQVAREHVSAAQPEGSSGSIVELEPLSEEKEKDLRSFMEAVYRRAAVDEVATEGADNSGSVNVSKFPEKRRGYTAGLPPGAYQGLTREEPVRILAAASSEQSVYSESAELGPEKLETLAGPDGTITFWALDQSVYVTISSAEQPSLLTLGSEPPLRLRLSSVLSNFWAVENITRSEVEAFLERRHKMPDQHNVSWS